MERKDAQMGKPAEKMIESVGTAIGWALCKKAQGGGPGKCDLMDCVCGPEGMACAQAAIAAMHVEVAKVLQAACDEHPDDQTAAIDASLAGTLALFQDAMKA